jgi:two-component system, cell cycle response regulator DivK
MRECSSSPSLLVVDDDDDNRDLYVEYAACVGWAAHAAKDGESAIEAARTLQPSIIVMDATLPGMSGFDTTRALKADPRTKAIPVVALTGLAEGTSRRAAKDAGCALFLTKPCSPHELVVHVCALLGIADVPTAKPAER